MAMVYVLTTLEGREWRPVAVVDESQKGVADQWADASKHNDWIPLEMNDLSLVSAASSIPLEFTPTPPVPVNEQEQNIMNSIAEIKDVNARLIGVIEQLCERHGEKDILKLVQKFKKTGGKRRMDFMVTWNLLPQRHAPSCQYRGWAEARYKKHLMIPGELPLEEVPKCNCLRDRLPKGLEYPEGHVGCADCGFDEVDGHYHECPRMQQQALFASEDGQQSLFESELLKKP